MQRINLRSVLVVTVLAGAGCGTTTAIKDVGDNKGSFAMQAAPELPSAQGNVKVVAKKDGQQRVVVEAKHLPPPSQADDDATKYVVWLAPEGAAEPFNVGTLEVKDGKGKFETMTPFRDFRISVTAEPQGNVQSPQGKSVMTALVRPTHQVY